MLKSLNSPTLRFHLERLIAELVEREGQYSTVIFVTKIYHLRKELSALRQEHKEIVEATQRERDALIADGKIKEQK